MRTAEPTSNRKPKHRWLQFSLRTLLVLVLIVSMPLGWFAFKLRQAREQREAIGRIEELGGFAVYDFEIDDHGLPTYPYRPPWLQMADDLLEEHSCATLVTAGIRQDRVHELDRERTDALLDRLVELTEVRTLYLLGGAVGDAGVKKLTSLNRIQRLYLSGTDVTDSGLQYLQALPQLEVLMLHTTKITDAGLHYLQGLHQLNELDLTDTQVTDAGVAELQQALPNVTIYR
jgi:hypothetical protein